MDFLEGLEDLIERPTDVRTPSTSPVARLGTNPEQTLRQEAARFGLRISSARRSPAQNKAVGGARGSFHLQTGLTGALDAAGNPKRMRDFAVAMRDKYGPELSELFHDPVGGWKFGKNIGPIGEHSDHVHIAWGGRPRAKTADLRSGLDDLIEPVGRVEQASFMSGLEDLVEQPQEGRVKTWDGYPAPKDQSGRFMTERSITVTDPRLNGGRPTNIPSLWKGKELPQEQAVQNALSSGKQFQSFDTLESAISAAESRTEDKARQIDRAVGVMPPRIGAVDFANLLGGGLIPTGFLQLDEAPEPEAPQQPPERPAIGLRLAPVESAHLPIRQEQGRVTAEPGREARAFSSVKPQDVSVAQPPAPTKSGTRRVGPETRTPSTGVRIPVAQINEWRRELGNDQAVIQRIQDEAARQIGLSPTNVEKLTALWGEHPLANIVESSGRRAGLESILKQGRSGQGTEREGIAEFYLDSDTLATFQQALRTVNPLDVQEAEAAKAAQPPPPSGFAEAVGGTIAPNVAEGLLSVPATILRGMDVAAQAIEGEDKPRFFGMLADKIERLQPGYLREKAAETGQTNIGKLSRGVGSAIGFAPLAAPGMVAAGLAGGLSNAGAVWDEAKQAGVPFNERLEAAGLGFLVGTTEAIPVGHGFERALKAVEGKQLAKAVVTEGLEEFGQEAFLQGIGNNLIARGYWDKDRPITKDIIENGLIGFFIGGAMGGAAGLASHMTRAAAEVEEAQPEAEVKPPAVEAQAVEKPQKGEQPNAVKERDIKESRQPKHIGVSPRGNLPEDQGQIREGEGRQAGGRGGVREEAGVGPEEIATRPEEKPKPEVAITEKPAPIHADKPATPVDQSAHQAATSPQNALPEPSEAQIDVGNYRKGHISVGGLDISVENPEGSVRRGTDEQGKPWEIELKSHYGYVRRSEGADGEQVDVFVKPGTVGDYSGPVFVINQANADGSFDEHKAVIGAPIEKLARAQYLANYEKGWDRIASVARFESPQQFKDWLKTADLSQPAISANTANIARATDVSAEAPARDVEAIAKRLGDISPRSVTGFFASVDRLRTAIAGDQKATQIAALKDVRDALRPENKALRKLFTEQTGIKLPKSRQDTGNILTKWYRDGAPFVTESQQTGQVPTQTVRERAAAKIAQAKEKQGKPPKPAAIHKTVSENREIGPPKTEAPISRFSPGSAAAKAAEAIAKRKADRQTPATQLSRQKVESQIVLRRLEKTAQGKGWDLEGAIRPRVGMRDVIRALKGTSLDIYALKTGLLDLELQEMGDGTFAIHRRGGDSQRTSKGVLSPKPQRRQRQSERTSVSQRRVTKAPPATLTEGRKAKLEALRDKLQKQREGLAEVTPRRPDTAPETEKARTEWNESTNQFNFNGAAMRALNRIRGTVVSGLTLTRAEARNTAKRAETLLKDRSLGPVERANVVRVMAALKTADAEELAIVGPRGGVGTQVHEQTHAAQLALERFFQAAPPKEQFDALPNLALGRKLLKLRGYTYVDDPRAAAHELFAHIAGGQWRDLGMPTGKAFEFFDAYLDLLGRTYKADALKRFDQLQDSFARWRDEKIKRLRAEEATRTAPSRTSSGGVPGVSQRREEGGTQGRVEESQEGLAEVARLEPEVESAIADIARDFLAEGNTDFDTLAAEFESVLGPELFDELAEYLPEIVARAEAALTKIVDAKSFRAAWERAARLTKEEADQLEVIGEAMARGYVKMNPGSNETDFYGLFAGIQRTEKPTKGPLGQPGKGSTTFLEDGRAVIKAFQSADISTALHETAHVARRYLDAPSLVSIEEWAGVKDGNWTRPSEEKFARAFERYFYEGVAPSKTLESAFAKIKEWMRAIYTALRGSGIDVSISPEAESVFAKILGVEKSAVAKQKREPEAVMSPEQRRQSILDRLKTSKPVPTPEPVVIRPRRATLTGDESLTSAVIKLGRLRSLGYTGKGEVKQLGAKEGGRIGLFSKSGLAVEDMIDNLNNAGYGPFENAEQLTAALDAETRGEMSYSSARATDEQVDAEWDDWGRNNKPYGEDHVIMTQAFDNPATLENARFIKAVNRVNDVEREITPKVAREFTAASRDIGLSDRTIDALLNRSQVSEEAPTEEPSDVSVYFQEESGLTTEQYDRVVEKLKALKKQGMSVDDYLAQQGLFGRELSPQQEELLKDLASGKGRRGKVEMTPQSLFDTAPTVESRQQSLLAEPERGISGPLLTQTESKLEDARRVGVGFVPPKFEIKKPIKGPTGAKIVGYEWKSKIGEKWSNRRQEYVEAQVSDWDSSETSRGTGRDIVHTFYVEHPDGHVTTEGIRSAQNILGISETRLQKLAKDEQVTQAARRRQDESLLRELEGSLHPTTTEAAQAYRRNSYSPLRSTAENDALFDRSVLFEKDGRYRRIDPDVSGARLLQENGWTRAAVDPAKQRAESEKTIGGPLFQEAEPDSDLLDLGRTYIEEGITDFKEWQRRFTVDLASIGYSVPGPAALRELHARLTRALPKPESSRIDENEHFNFRRSAFTNPDVERAFRQVVKNAVAETGQQHKQRVSRQEHLARVREMHPDLVPMIKDLRPNMIASRNVFAAAVEYAQTLTREAQTLRTELIRGEMTPSQAFDAQNQIDQIEHDATEIMSQVVGVRSEFGRNLALLAAQKTDQMSPERVLQFAHSLAQRHGMEIDSTDWRNAERRLVAQANEARSAQAEIDRLRTEIAQAKQGRSTARPAKPKSKTWQAVMTEKLTAMEAEALARLQERPNTLYQEEEINLPVSVEDVAVIVAARIARGGNYAELIGKLRAEHPIVFESYENDVKARADAILKDQRRRALVEASHDKEQAPTARQVLAEDVRESQRAVAAAKIETERKRKQLETTWQADSDAAAQEASLAWEQANKAIAETLDRGADKKVAQQQRAFAAQQKKAVAAEAKRLSEAARRAEIQRQEQIAEEAREQLEAAKEAARQARENELAAERAARRATREQGQRELHWDYQIRQNATEARDRLGQASYTPNIDDLAAIGAGLSREIADQRPADAPERWHREMQQYGRPYRDNVAAIRDRVSSLLADARTSFKNRRLQERAAGGREAVQYLPADRLAELTRQLDVQLKRRQDAQRALAKELAKIERRSFSQRAIDALGLVRSLRSSVDLPFFRQGIVPMFTHPLVTARAMWASLSTWTEAQMNRRVEDFAAHPMAELMRESGLDLTSLEMARSPLSLAAMEEQFQSRVARAIPWVRVSERQFVVGMDSIRVALFERYATDLMRNHRPDLDPEPFQQLARLINIMTGRGDVGKLKSVTPALNIGLWSTRLMVSRLQWLNLLANPLAYRKMSPAVRRIAAKNAAVFLASQGALMLVAHVLGLTSFDPDDDDFMKLRIPGTNTKYDFTGGFQQYIKTAVRLARSGYRKAVGELEFKGDRFQDTLLRFGRSKLAPGPSIFVDWLTGTNFIGEPFTWSQVAVESVAPMAGKDIVEAIRLDGTKGLLPIPFILAGISVSTFRSRQMPDQTHSKAERYATGFIRDRMGSKPQTKEEYKRRTLITELVAARKSGQSADAILKDIEKAGGALTDEEQTKVEERVKQIPLERAYRQLSGEQKEAVLEVATPEERVAIEPAYKNIKMRLDDLKHSDEYKQMTQEQRTEAVREVLSEERAASKKNPNELDSERELRIAVQDAKDQVETMLLQHSEYRSLPDEKSKQAARRGVSDLFRTFSIGQAELKLPERARNQRAQRMRTVLQQWSDRGVFERQINGIITKAKRRAA